MSNHIEFSNTPIFDELSRERGYNRLIARGAIQLRPAYTGRSTAIQGVKTYGEITDEWISPVSIDTDAVIGSSTSRTYDEVVALAVKFSKPTEEQTDEMRKTVQLLQSHTPKIIVIDEGDELDAEPIVLGPNFWKMTDEE